MGVGRADELRSNFIFHEDGELATASRARVLAPGELEFWRHGSSWENVGSGVSLAPGDQLLPLPSGTVLIKTEKARRSLIIEAGLKLSDHRLTPITRLMADVDNPNARLIAPPRGSKDCIALVPAYADGSTTFWRLLAERGLELLAQSLPGRFAGGRWLDRDGRWLLANQSVDENPYNGVVIDFLQGTVELLFKVSTYTNDRVRLASQKSKLMVASTDAGGVDRIGFAYWPDGKFGFPEEVASQTGIEPLALNPAGDNLLLREQCGVVSVLRTYDIDNRRLADLEAPFGHMRGGAAWGRRGITVPWSTPDLPHLLLEYDNDGRPRKRVDAGRKTEKSTIRLPCAAGSVEAIVYGAENPWWDSEKIVLALHGGPAAAWHYEYNPLFAELSSIGMTVLALNQRGSSGYGREYIDSIRGAWGRVDADDICQIIDWLNEQREPGRSSRGVGIFGVSYGAFLALLVSCLAPDSVRACAALSPFLSPRSLYSGGSTGVRQLIVSLNGCAPNSGSTGSRDVEEFIDRLTASMLVLHGRDDNLIPVEQSRRLIEALHSRNSDNADDVTYLELEAVGHDLLDGRNAAFVSNVVCNFFAKELTT